MNTKRNNVGCCMEEMEMRKDVESEERTKLGEEEEKHYNGGSDSDESTGECTVVKIFADFGIGVQFSNLVHQAFHNLRKSEIWIRDEEKKYVCNKLNYLNICYETM